VRVSPFCLENVRSSIFVPEPRPLTTPSSSLKAMRIASLITAINVMVASGFSIAGLISPASILPTHYVLTEASSIFAMYAAARTLPLAVMTLMAVYKRSVSALLILGTLAGIVQAADCLVGLVQRDPGKIFGPLGIAVLQAYAVATLRKLGPQLTAALPGTIPG
jgi:hypothetical protein